MIAFGGPESIGVCAGGSPMTAVLLAALALAVSVLALYVATAALHTAQGRGRGEWRGKQAGE